MAASGIRTSSELRRSIWSRFASTWNSSSIISYGEEVRQAIHDQRPLVWHFLSPHTKSLYCMLIPFRGQVALESTIISHGMPYPQNVQTALAVQNLIRAEGAVPATIAIIGGKIRVGLSAYEVFLLSSQ